MPLRRQTLRQMLLNAMAAAPLIVGNGCSGQNAPLTGITSGGQSSSGSASTGSGTSGSSGTSSGTSGAGSGSSGSGSGSSGGTTGGVVCTQRFPGGPFPRLSDGGLDCNAACPPQFGTPADCYVDDTTDPAATLVCDYDDGCLMAGRRPVSLLGPGRPMARNRVGAHFAEAARLESASVTAFRILRRELRDHRAPAELLRAAERGAIDEIAHTRTISALAARYGAHAVRPRMSAVPATRTLEEIALENAIEGCVRETYSVLVGRWQAVHAADPVIRLAMDRIAEDETRHAELAWAVAAWVEPRLSRAARARMADARNETIESLRGEVASQGSECELVAGLPVVAVEQALIGGLMRQLDG
jgi:hypothetical protein